MGFAAAVGARGCTAGPQPGTVDLANTLLHRWGPLGAYTLGIYNCRKIAGTSTYSLHAEGRAFDLGIPGDSAPELGNAVLSSLLEHQGELLQRIIWWHTVYDYVSPRGRPLGSGDPHTSHLHIESAWSSASGLTAEEIAALLGESAPISGDSMTLIVAYNGAQWAVSADLSSRVGLSQQADVEALLRLNSGTLYAPAVLSTSLMARIPEVRSA